MGRLYKCIFYCQINKMKTKTCFSRTKISIKLETEQSRLIFHFSPLHLSILIHVWSLFGIGVYPSPLKTVRKVVLNDDERWLQSDKGMLTGQDHEFLQLRFDFAWDLYPNLAFFGDSVESLIQSTLKICLRPH